MSVCFLYLLTAVTKIQTGVAVIELQYNGKQIKGDNNKHPVNFILELGNLM